LFHVALSNNDAIIDLLTVDGESDWMDYRAAKQAMKGMNVPTKLMRIPNAGHHLYLDNPPAFDKAIFQVITHGIDQLNVN
jgi:cardiolipin-specific phospholipase